MMTREDRQEALSLAYVHAVAAVSGMTHSKPSKDYGIDLSLHGVEWREHRLYQNAIQLDLQVKSTTTVVETRTTIAYDLSIRAYDDLRLELDRERILAVCVLPPDEGQWLKQTPSKLELRKCTYWLSLRGQPFLANRRSVRVMIPKRQIFTPESLRWIMERIRLGEELS